jgi:hypothetical protein
MDFRISASRCTVLIGSNVAYAISLHHHEVCKPTPVPPFTRDEIVRMDCAVTAGNLLVAPMRLISYQVPIFIRVFSPCT